MKKLTYSDWQSIEYFIEKYGDLRNWIGFESRKEEIKNINPRLIELNDDIIKLKQDLDLDQILDLDHDTDSTSEKTKPMFDLEKEFTTTQFKVDSRIEIIEDPQINFKPVEKKMDQFKVHIRGPQKS